MALWKWLLKTYATFSGRVGRAFVARHTLFLMGYFLAVSFVKIFVGRILLSIDTPSVVVPLQIISIGLDVLSWALVALAIVGNASLLIRRCHDIGRSGWWLLVYVLDAGITAALQQFFVEVNSAPLSIVVALLAIAWAILPVLIPGERTDNRFGPAQGAKRPG